MNDMKLGRRCYMTVVQGEKGNPTPGYEGRIPIYTLRQYFTMRVKHKKGSTRPVGWFHNHGFSSNLTVEVRWLWTEEHQYFAPEITFRPSETGAKVAWKVSQALVSMRRTSEDETQPDALADLLGAVTVEYVDDNKEGCWDDYRPLRVPGEPAMMTIARYASRES